MMGNTIVVFRLFLQSGLLEYHSLYSLQSLLSSTAPLPKMDSKKNGSAFIKRYLKEQNHSSEEEKEVESLIDDFEPFVVVLRHYSADTSLTERKSQLARGLITLRKNQFMPYII